MRCENTLAARCLCSKTMQQNKNESAFFCSLAAQQAGENLVGTAGNYQTYVLIECPLPWPAIAFDSAYIPPALRQSVKALGADKTVRFLCIHRETAEPSDDITLLIYEQVHKQLLSHLAGDEGIAQFSNGYCGYEFHLPDLDSVVPFLENYWQNRAIADGHRQLQGQPIIQQDVLVCTHGMRDKCCARLGKPLFKGAMRMVEEGALPNTRVWRASHIGGHRFAPTAIVFPEGRYYGRLSLLVLQSIVAREGEIDQLRSVYRGWSVLPKLSQLLEAELLFKYGWSWLRQSVAFYPLCIEAEKKEIVARLSARSPSGETVIYRASIVEDGLQTYVGKASCGDLSPSRLVKYAIADWGIESNGSNSNVEVA